MKANISCLKPCSLLSYFFSYLYYYYSSRKYNICVLFCFTVKTYEDMTLEELEENEDEFGEDDEAAIEMYR